MREPQFNVRMSQELKDKVAALAEKNKRSMNAEIVAAIEDAVRKPLMAQIEELRKERDYAEVDAFMSERAYGQDVFEEKLVKLEEITKKLQDLLK
ncbi:Arc-like DNA binding domain protein [Serratia grimesii]|uniref:Arc family DNA-binding protein n=1 Tax=Serratia grimesii TaxID=82995 RepID=UPI00076F3B71|nr:Arc family DNA-binding protein [Serratia grimesii]CUW11836.1 Arc-like DNA binding domain protein [Serratia grimesii]SMZ56194.1 Arc-like DNA binding domain protein [Serratia grimesii]